MTDAIACASSYSAVSSCSCACMHIAWSRLLFAMENQIDMWIVPQTNARLHLGPTCTQRSRPSDSLPRRLPSLPWQENLSFCVEYCPPAPLFSLQQCILGFPLGPSNKVWCSGDVQPCVDVRIQRSEPHACFLYTVGQSPGPSDYTCRTHKVKDEKPSWSMMPRPTKDDPIESGLPSVLLSSTKSDVYESD